MVKKRNKAIVVLLIIVMVIIMVEKQGELEGEFLGALVDQYDCIYSESGYDYTYGTKSFFVNYINPDPASYPYAIWRVKHGFEDEQIMLPQGCYDYNPIRVRVFSQVETDVDCSVLSSPVSIPQCFDGSSWIDIGIVSSGGDWDCNIQQAVPTYSHDGDWNTYASYSVYYDGWFVNDAYENGARVYEEGMYWCNEPATTCSYPSTNSCTSIIEQAQIMREVVDGDCTQQEAQNCQLEYNTINDEWCEFYGDEWIISSIGSNSIVFGPLEYCSGETHFLPSCDGMTPVETWTNCADTGQTCEVGTGCVGGSVCTPGERMCVSDTEYRVCDISGQWGANLACSGGTPYCDSVSKFCEECVFDFHCGGSYECNDNVCELIGGGCSETDNGVAEGTYGVTTDATGSSSDYCTSTDSVMEFYCDADVKKSINLACPGSIPYCDGGECGPLPPPCSDTDGGIDYYVKGTVTDDWGSDTDYCNSMSPDYLSEFYCQGDTAVYEWYKCPNGCLLGECQSVTCNTDADTNCDGLVDNTELLSGISNWVNDVVGNTELLTYITAWVNS